MCSHKPYALVITHTLFQIVRTVPDMVLAHANSSLTIPERGSWARPGTSPSRHRGEARAVLEAELNHMDRDTPCSWSWEQWVVLGTLNSCSLYIHNTAHTGSTYTWNWTSVLCVRSQGVKQRTPVMAHCLWNVGLRDRPCITLTVYGWKRDRIQFSHLFSISSPFLSLIISFPHYWLGSRCKNDLN